jgi:hypothetical protein
MEWLVKNGHPKWKAVNLDFPLKGWDQYDCVAKHVRRPGRPAATSTTSAPLNPVLDAMKTMLGN